MYRGSLIGIRQLLHNYQTQLLMLIKIKIYRLYVNCLTRCKKNTFRILDVGFIAASSRQLPISVTRLDKKKNASCRGMCGYCSLFNAVNSATRAF